MSARLYVELCPEKLFRFDIIKKKIEEIKLKVDGYTKFILTVIAVVLLGPLFKPLLFSKNLTASQQEINVNITKIDGYSISSSFGTPIFSFLLI